MRRRLVNAVEARPHDGALWNGWPQQWMSGTWWTVTRNYFTSSPVATQWPSGNMVHRALTKLLGRISETTRKRLIT